MTGSRWLLLVLALSACTSPGGPDGGTLADAACADAACQQTRICDVTAYGAVGDGKTKDTQAIQAAIDACAQGGGTVSLHDGTFLSGMITLRSDITLDIAPTATLLGSQSSADYPDTDPPTQNSQISNCKKALVYAQSADHVTLKGGGTIDGNARGVPSWNGDSVPEATRPMAVFTVLSTHVSIQDLTVKDAATWAVVNMEVDQLTISGLTIDSNLGATHDGIDVVDGHHVLIENSTVTSGDDSICLKSGSQTGTADVVVQGCHTLQSGVANGVKLGTASVGSFNNITVKDVTVDNAQAAGLAVESVDGAHIANVSFNRITLTHVGTPFFVLLGSRNREATQVGAIDGVAFNNITGSDLLNAWGSLVTGSVVGGQTFSLSNLSFSGIDLSLKGAGSPANPPPFTAGDFPEYQGPVPDQPGVLYNQYPDARFIAGTGGQVNTDYYAPGFAFFVRHAGNVSFANCQTTLTGVDQRPWLASKDVTAITGTCGP